MIIIFSHKNHEYNFKCTKRKSHFYAWVEYYNFFQCKNRIFYGTL